MTYTRGVQVRGPSGGAAKGRLARGAAEVSTLTQVKDRKD